MINQEDVSKMIAAMMTPTNLNPVFFSAGTGIPDEMAVKYFEDTDVKVITRDGTEWKNGKRIEK